MVRMLVIPLDTLRAEQAPLAGGKGANPGRLLRFGLPAPPLPGAAGDGALPPPNPGRYPLCRHGAAARHPPDCA